jgi:hypothetical protein
MKTRLTFLIYAFLIALLVNGCEMNSLLLFPTTTPTPTSTPTSTATVTAIPTVTPTFTPTATSTPKSVEDQWVIQPGGFSYNPKYLLNGQLTINPEYSNHHWDKFWRGLYKFNKLFNNYFYGSWSENDFISDALNGQSISKIVLPQRGHGCIKPDKYSGNQIKAEIVSGKDINPNTILVRVFDSDQAAAMYPSVNDWENKAVCPLYWKCIQAVFFEVVQIPESENWYLQLTLVSYSPSEGRFLGMSETKTNIENSSAASQTIALFEYLLGHINSVQFTTQSGWEECGWEVTNSVNFPSERTMEFYATEYNLFTVP